MDVSAHKDVADVILTVEPHGLDKAVEASGFRSTSSVLHTVMRGICAEGDSGDTVSEIIKATRKGGNIALIGDFFFTTNQFPIGALMEKAITLRGGQLYAQKVLFLIPTHDCYAHEIPVFPIFARRYHERGIRSILYVYIR